MHRHNRHGIGNINLEIDDNIINYININYVDKNNLNYIKTNKENIASNLGKIDTNKEDIASNLSEITYIKNNSKSYLKNIYNILFYDKKHKLILEIIFKIKHLMLMLKNHFLEINLKMLLDYGNITESHIVITAFKLINDNKEEIYVATYKNGDDILYKNFVFLINLFFIISKKIQKNYKY